MVKFKFKISILTSVYDFCCDYYFLITTTVIFIGIRCVYYLGNDIWIFRNNNEFQEGLQTRISNLNKLEDSLVSF